MLTTIVTTLTLEFLDQTAMMPIQIHKLQRFGYYNGSHVPFSSTNVHKSEKNYKTQFNDEQKKTYKV